MTADPRAALGSLVAAMERHLEASSTRRGEDDPHVVAAYDDLADAFLDYDEALLEAYGEMTPLVVYDADEDGDDDSDDEDDDIDDADEDDEDDAVYSGLDDDYDLDDDTGDAPGSADPAGSRR